MSAEEGTYIAKVLHNTLRKSPCIICGWWVSHLMNQLLQVRRRHGVAAAGRRTLRGVAHGGRLLQEAVVRQQRALVELRQRHEACAAALACAACQGAPDSASSEDSDSTLPMQAVVHVASCHLDGWQGTRSGSMTSNTLEAFLGQLTPRHALLCQSSKVSRPHPWSPCGPASTGGCRYGCCMRGSGSVQQSRGKPRTFSRLRVQTHHTSAFWGR